MRTLTVVYHYEDETWWAETDAVPGFVAGAATFEEARTLTHEGLQFELDDQVELDERFDAPALAARRADDTVSSPVAGVTSIARSRASTTGSPVITRSTAPSRPVLRGGSMASSAV